MVLSGPCHVNRPAMACGIFIHCMNFQGRTQRGRCNVMNFNRVRARALALGVCLLAWLAVMPPAAAVQVDGLYRATVPVTDRSEAVRATAFQQALSQVLVKVTGDAAAASSPALATALQQPSQYIQQYGYRQSTSSPGTPVALQLQVRFDPPAIDQLLSAAQLPLWGRERPLVVMWVGVDPAGAGRYIVAGDGDPAHADARGALQQAADARGLPVLFPLLDLQDQGAVRFSDLDGGFMDTVVAASARYEGNAVVAGVVRPSVGGQWRGQWWLVFRHQTDHWVTQGAGRDAALAAGVDGVADRLAALLAVGGGMQASQMADGAMRVEIAGVTQVSAYARIDHLLTRLAPIASAQMVAASGDRVTFSVTPRGSVDDVARNLALVSWLMPMPAPSPSVSSAVPGGMPVSGGLPAASSVAMPAEASVASPVPVPMPVKTLYFRYQP